MSDFYTKSDTIRDLTSLGVMPGDTILVHSSYKALGCIIGGAKTIFEAFFELLGPDGTLIFPALSYETVTRENPVFDIYEAREMMRRGFLWAAEGKRIFRETNADPDKYVSNKKMY